MLTPNNFKIFAIVFKDNECIWEIGASFVQYISNIIWCTWNSLNGPILPIVSEIFYNFIIIWERDEYVLCRKIELKFWIHYFLLVEISKEQEYKQLRLFNAIEAERIEKTHVISIQIQVTLYFLFTDEKNYTVLNLKFLEKQKMPKIIWWTKLYIGKASYTQQTNLTLWINKKKSICKCIGKSALITLLLFRRRKGEKVYTSSIYSFVSSLLVKYLT